MMYFLFWLVTDFYFHFTDKAIEYTINQAFANQDESSSDFELTLRGDTAVLFEIAMGDAVNEPQSRLWDQMLDYAKHKGK